MVRGGPWIAACGALALMVVVAPAASAQPSAVIPVRAATSTAIPCADGACPKGKKYVCVRRMVAPRKFLTVCGCVKPP